MSSDASLSRVAKRLPDRRADRAPFALLVGMRGGSFRLRQKLPGADQIHETETRGEKPGGMRTEKPYRGPDDGADHDAGVGRCREPAEGFRPVLRFDRISDVSLHHTGGAAARALHDATEEQHRDRVREREDQKGQTGPREADQERGPPAETIGKAPPERRRRYLSDGEGSDHEPNHGGSRVEPHRVERQQREDHRVAEHVDERVQEQDPEFAEAHEVLLDLSFRLGD